MTRLITDIEHLKTVIEIPFSDAQVAAIVAPADGTHSIIAGAGSGKTTVMAARVVWLVGHLGIAPERILGLTFTNKAAGELRQRVRESLKRAKVELDGAEPTVSTYHAFAGQLLAEHGMRLGLEPSLGILTDARRHLLVARMLRDRTEPLRYVSADTRTLVKDVLGLDGELNEHDVSTEALRDADRALIESLDAEAQPLKLHSEIADTARKRIELAGLVDGYRAAKLAAGYMDFSDQMAWGKQLSELREVQESMAQRFDIVLLDEYQDTSVAQRDLLVNLFGGHGADATRHGVTAVGDPAQGIYGWRGAASGNLEGFLADFGASDAEPFTLTTTRRCGQNIIAVANKIASPFYEPEGGPDRRHLRLSSAKSERGVVSAALHLTIVDEIADLVRRIRELNDAGTRLRDIGVLVRVARENHELVAAFRAAGIRVEIVGLKGLLNQPEVVDLVSTLEAVDDMTANPSVLRLLAGPRWRIGDRDLALLGQRATQLARAEADFEGGDEPLVQALNKATAGSDPTEVVSLAEALEDLGPLPYSAQARARFHELAGVLRHLRAHQHEPLIDLMRRAQHQLDLDVELDVAGIGPDNLALLFEAVNGYGASDPFASLSGLLAYLRAESDYADGLDVASPSDSDSVKLLTIHKAKGLEYEHVFVPFVAKGVFPSGRSRSRWTSNAGTLPTALRGDSDTLPDIREFSTAGLKAFKQESQEESLMEEVRLGYVAATRAKSSLHISGHRWDRTITKPREISPFMTDVVEWLASQGRTPDVWAHVDQEDPEQQVNPLSDIHGVAWPVVLAGLDPRRRFVDVVRAAQRDNPGLPETDDPQVAELIADVDLLLAQADDRVIEVPLPETLSATAAMALAKDEQAFARALARPVPRQPVGAARTGTSFHAWVETRLGQQPLLDPGDLPGSGEVALLDEDFTDADLDALKAAFEAGPYAERTPFAVETPFTVRLGGQQIIGRIDAVFAMPDGGFQVVDWKTNRAKTADPLQLAIYRLAWAEQQGVVLNSVTGAFYYVRLGEVETFENLPDRAALESLLGLA
jgi:DNA helicase-2/ATP-dependent DNA helicase PcrA